MSLYGLPYSFRTGSTRDDNKLLEDLLEGSDKPIDETRVPPPEEPSLAFLENLKNLLVTSDEEAAAIKSANAPTVDANTPTGRKPEESLGYTIWKSVTDNGTKPVNLNEVAEQSRPELLKYMKDNNLPLPNDKSKNTSDPNRAPGSVLFPLDKKVMQKVGKASTYKPKGKTKKEKSKDLKKGLKGILNRPITTTLPAAKQAYNLEDQKRIAE